MKAINAMDNRTSLIIDDIVAFLKKVPPFFSLGDANLKSVAKHLSVEFYPKGTVIFKQNDSSSDSLRIIKKGGSKIARVSSENGEEIIADYLGEGDTFGFLSLVSRDRMWLNITAVEDTICYALGKEVLLSLLSSQLSFTEYFLKSHSAKYVDRTVLEMQGRNMFRSGDRILFATRVGDIAIKNVVSTREDTTILAAAQVMAAKRISSIIIRDHDNRPCGIVTDRDLRKKVVAQGRNVLEPIKNIMSAPLISVDVQDYCFEIVLKMIKYNIHHITVTRDGSLSGVITNHDLMMLQGGSPLPLTVSSPYRKKAAA